jgi:hypothetical protein
MKKTKDKSMNKQYGCINCHQVWQEEELITVHNIEWVMQEVDDECCPDCRSLCVELED